MEYPCTNQLLYIKKNVINVLLRNSNSEPFKVPVNIELLHIPQYPKLIKCPMDFGTIKMKLDKQVYQTANECKSDFLDVFRNCYIFNEPGSLYVDMALKLENLFKRKMADLPVPEHYVPDSAFHTPKSSKIKKGKSLKFNTPSVKAKASSNHSVVSNSSVKNDTSIIQKRIRSDSNHEMSKEEPLPKKAKVGIDLKICKQIILNLMSKKYNDWNRYFLEPVDVEGLKLHDYFDIVKKPMDLGTVKRKLFENCYQSNEEFAEDVRLIFHNCYLYNPDGHEVNRCGKLLEGIFVKLYQGAFLSSARAIVKSMRARNTYDDLQPLLQKILRRQSEIDTLHVDILRRNKEIRQSIDFINSTELIKSFKASVNLNNNTTNTIVKKPSNYSLNHEQKFDKKISPKPSTFKPELKIETNISKFSSNPPMTSLTPTEVPASPNPISSKPESVRDTIGRFSETKKSSKSTYQSDSNNSDEAPKVNNIKRPLNNVNNHSLPDHKSNNSDNNVSQTKPIFVTETPKPETKKPIKNSEEYNSRLKEIKAWIGSSSTELASRIREFINKSENKNVVSVNLLKLKPITISGLYKMMTDPAKDAQNSDENNIVLKEFTIEDRMQLSQDLRLLGEKFSEKILHIYKKTEDVQSSDGECEIDFQTMKLITLHSLREFADKCLQKKREKQSKKVGNSGGDSDSDSSDSSDSDGSDSNSDATTSSSDNDFFNNLPKAVTNNVETSSQGLFANNVPKLNQEFPKPIIELPSNDLSQSTMISMDKHLIDITQEESRLSDSSDSDKEDDEEDTKINSTPKRLIYTALWNKSSSSDNKKPINTPAQKQNSLSRPHPMYNNSARNQLNETLRQIAQDAQAHENVKKQEEELRLVRMKEEEEHKKQQMLKLQAINETRKQMHHTENLRKEEDLLRQKEQISNDRKQRSLDIPCVPEREDYHQILCDFEYNIDQDLIMKFVNLDQKHIHL